MRGDDLPPRPFGPPLLFQEGSGVASACNPTALAVVLRHEIIEMFAASAEDDRLGIPVRRVGERIEYAYPIAILTADNA